MDACLLAWVLTAGFVNSVVEGCFLVTLLVCFVCRLLFGVFVFWFVVFYGGCLFLGCGDDCVGLATCGVSCVLLSVGFDLLWWLWFYCFFSVALVCICWLPWVSGLLFLVIVMVMELFVFWFGDLVFIWFEF